MSATILRQIASYQAIMTSPGSVGDAMTAKYGEGCQAKTAVAVVVRTGSGLLTVRDTHGQESSRTLAAGSEWVFAFSAIVTLGGTLSALEVYA